MVSVEYKSFDGKKKLVPFLFLFLLYIYLHFRPRLFLLWLYRLSFFFPVSLLTRTYPEFPGIYMIYLVY